MGRILQESWANMTHYHHSKTLHLMDLPGYFIAIGKTDIWINSFLPKKIQIRVFTAATHSTALTFKMPRKPASENVVCLCRLLNILANSSNLFLHTGKQCGP